MDPQPPASPQSRPRFELGVDDALLTRLGRVTALWGYVEMLVGRMLAQLCGAEPSPMLSVIADLSGEALLNSAARLSRLKLASEIDAQVQQVLAEADVLRRDHEMLARGLWDRGRDPGTAVLSTPHPVRREIVWRAAVTQAELADIEEHACHIVGELARLCLQIGVRFDQD